MMCIIEHGVYFHRHDWMPPGAWTATESPFDRAFTYVREELCMMDRGGRAALLRAINMQSEYATRLRRTKIAVPIQHLAKLSMFSGIPLAELCELGCCELITPHPNARKT